jgi:hypothetical protein
MIYAETPLDTALELMHRFGFWPIPILPGSKIPLGWSRNPPRPTEASLKAVFAAYPGAGVGLLLGPDSGIIDIECDGPAGPDSLIKLLGGRVQTMGWSSARGPHHLFRYDARLARHGKNVLITAWDLPGLEIRIGGVNGPLQSNCPPTVGADGKPRTWNGCDVVARLPDSVFRFLAEIEWIALDGLNYASENFADPAVKKINDAWFRLSSETQERLSEMVRVELEREQLVEAV